MIERLTRHLRPERACEEDVIEAAAAFPNAGLLTAMVEPLALQRERLHGAETGRREVAEELAADR